jgi:fructan beta-fructosidase
MHWGHAISNDLTNWQHLPVALEPDENGMIFSGSVVIDWQNSAGFGKEAMIAIFTHHKDGHQSQSLAYSQDEGITWTKYFNNPVLISDNDRDFRDPRVFRYHDGWVMSLAAGNTIVFYRSTDLIHWEASGSFRNHGSREGVWETPDLFELTVGDSAETRWVLTVSVGDGHPAGGSGTQYFVGHFDGRSFRSENTPDTILWADFGADYYAPQSWNDEPQGRRLMIGWMNNWQYASRVPTSGWRGSLSLIRELSLKVTEAGIRLFHQPIREMKALRNTHRYWQSEALSPTKILNLSRASLEILATFQLRKDIDQLELQIGIGEHERTIIGYSVKESRVFVDRTHSGQGNFHAGFARVHAVPLHCRHDVLHLHIFVDQCSVEVFANNGSVVITDSIFPSYESTRLELTLEGAEALIYSLDVFQLAPAQYTAKEVLSC